MDKLSITKLTILISGMLILLGFYAIDVQQPRCIILDNLKVLNKCERDIIKLPTMDVSFHNNAFTITHLQRHFRFCSDLSKNNCNTLSYDTLQYNGLDTILSDSQLIWIFADMHISEHCYGEKVSLIFKSPEPYYLQGFCRICQNNFIDKFCFIDSISNGKIYVTELELSMSLLIDTMQTKTLDDLLAYLKKLTGLNGEISVNSSIFENGKMPSALCLWRTSTTIVSPIILPDRTVTCNQWEMNYEYKWDKC